MAEAARRAAGLKKLGKIMNIDSDQGHLVRRSCMWEGFHYEDVSRLDSRA